jgi:hypothetical protein
MSTLKKTVPIAVIAALAMTSTATAAKPVKYVGKTSSGHKVTFTKKGKRIHNMSAGVRMSCIPIQGGGSPTGGPEVWSFSGHVPAGRHVKFSFMSKPAFHYNEVTMNHDLWTKRRPGRRISGRMRLQYQFLIPKYPIGTFSIYSCLGGAKFKAKPR